jgi:hypothetical protein
MAELSVRWRYAVAAVASAINATTKGLRNSIQVLGCLSFIVKTPSPRAQQFANGCKRAYILYRYPAVPLLPGVISREFLNLYNVGAQSNRILSINKSI